MTSSQLAPILHVHETALRREAAAGRVPGRRLGQRFLFSKAAILKWLNESSVSATQAEQGLETVEELPLLTARKRHPHPTDRSYLQSDLAREAAEKVLEITRRKR